MRIPFRQAIGQIRTFAAALTAQRFLASQNGSASLPTIRPGTDTDTGLYYDATKGLVSAVDGVDRIMSRTNGENRIVSAASRGTPIAAIYNAVGNMQFFVSDASPEGVVTANPGNWCTNATAGTWYKKQTGTGNTGWREVSPSLSGTWTPTGTIVTNLDGLTPGVGYYIRVGDVVVGGVQATADPTAASYIEYRLSLPVASNFSATGDATGLFFHNGTVGTVSAHAATDTLYLWAGAAGTASVNDLILFAYRVI